MKIGVCNDIHSAHYLLCEVLRGLMELNDGDCLVINGDLANRGMITNPIVALYYNAKRSGSETDKKDLLDLLHLYDENIVLDDLVEKSIHSGTFLSELARRYPLFKQVMEDELQENMKYMRVIGTFAHMRGVRVYFVPGNGEIFPLDFDTSEGVDKEKLVPEPDRVLSRLRSSGIFGQNHVILVDYPLVLRHRVALIPLNVIDQNGPMDISGEDLTDVTHVITHYPPTAESMFAFFGIAFGYNPNQSEYARFAATSRHLMEFKNRLHVYCGHIHPGADKQRNMALPVSANFRANDNTITWVKPGYLEIFEI